MKQLFRMLVLLPLLPGFLYAQVGQEAGIGLYGGTAFLSHVRRSDDFKGRYTPNESRSHYGGVGIYQPALRCLGIGLELGYQQSQFDYRYSTDQINVVVYNRMKYHAVVLSPSLTLNPRFLKGVFARLAIPVEIPVGNQGTYSTVTYDFINPPVYADHSAQVAAYRRNLTGPEFSLGYLYTWKNGSGIWVRGSTWRAATMYWKPSFTETPELPTLKRLSIELGFRMGTPGLRLFKFPEKPVDPNKPTLKQRMREQPWLEPY